MVCPYIQPKDVSIKQPIQTNKYSLCTTPYAVCKPTARAKTLGRLLWYIMIILFALMICGFIGGYFQLSILCIFLVITGFCGVRYEDAYNIEQILCVTFFSGYIWVYTLVDLILKIIAYSLDVSVFTLIALFGGVVFYGASCIVGKLLYDELRTNYTQIADPSLQGPSFMQRFRGMGPSNPSQSVPEQPSAEEVPRMLYTLTYHFILLRVFYSKQ